METCAMCQTLSIENADLKRDLAQWKNNHAVVVAQARVLKERTDMPFERVKAYETWGEVLAKNVELELYVGNLLARIHRDGGHHQMEHGNAESVRAADLVVAETYAEVARLTYALSLIAFSSRTRIGMKELALRALGLKE